MSENSGITAALEDYLEAIYVLQKTRDIVKVVDIAEHLKVTMPSVNGGIKRLASLGYVIHEKWRQVKLTEEGENIAISVNRRHKDLSAFYHDILGVDEDSAEESACKVEHVLDPAIIERIISLTHWIRSLPPEDRKSLVNAIEKK